MAAAVDALRGARRVSTPSSSVAGALRRLGLEVSVDNLSDMRPEAVDAVALFDDELSYSDHDEVLLAEAARVAGPGGTVAVSAISAIRATNNGSARGYRADEVRRALGHHGIDVTLLCAPGVSTLVAGAADAALDCEPGLLDAGLRLLAVGRVGLSQRQRSRVFFDTLPRKVVAAAVICRDDSGRLLVVFDNFKGEWTLPGGVVDAGEDPRSGAVREAWEEAGVHVHAGSVLGVFAAGRPDRVVLVYDAEPLAGEVSPRGPVNAHEITEVAWVTLSDALQRLDPAVAFQVRACLREPGGTFLLPT